MSNQKPIINFGKFVDVLICKAFILRQKVSNLKCPCNILTLNLLNLFCFSLFKAIDPLF